MAIPNIEDGENSHSSTMLMRIWFVITFLESNLATFNLKKRKKTFKMYALYLNNSTFKNLAKRKYHEHLKMYIYKDV